MLDSFHRKLLPRYSPKVPCSMKNSHKTCLFSVRKLKVSSDKKRFPNIVAVILPPNPITERSAGPSKADLWNVPKQHQDSRSWEWLFKATLRTYKQITDGPHYCQLSMLIWFPSHQLNKKPLQKAIYLLEKPNFFAAPTKKIIQRVK